VVETSAPQLEAGRNTTIFLLITNPYDEAVKIVSAQTKVPVDFKDAAQEPFSFWKGIWEKAKEETDLEKLQVVSGVSLSDVGLIQSSERSGSIIKFKASSI